MESYKESTRPITPPSDHHSKRTSGHFSGPPIPNLEYVDQSMPTAATSNIPASSTIHHDDRKASHYSPALKNMDAIDPTYSPNLRSTNQDGFLGRNTPQHNLSPDGPYQESTSMKPPLEKKNVSPTMHREFDSLQRNETTSRIEREVYHILHWNQPVRSGIALGSIAGSILLTRWYSPLQISAAVLTMATLVNLVYVNFMVQSQKVIYDDQSSHPYQNVIRNEKSLYIDRDSVTHYSSVFIEVAETVIRALTRIVFVEDTLTSLKWMTIFFIIWKVSAHVATMDIILALVISAFTFPRLYMSNKDIVDSHIQKGHHMIQTGLSKAQETAEQGVKDAYGKAKAYISQTGTTSTDAKNTMNDTSATLKNQ
ncbi:hypothetical protein K501DRAFT_283914 [Backusella circina FSU 941]|nr:hypothetical protein K501DRAFT_283914 [Backusella circina FSU 941]